MGLVTQLKGKPYSFRRYWWLILSTFPNTKKQEEEFQTHLGLDWDGARYLAAFHLLLTVIPLIPVEIIRRQIPLLLIAMAANFIATGGLIALGYWLLLRKT